MLAGSDKLLQNVGLRCRDICDEDYLSADDNT